MSHKKIHPRTAILNIKQKHHAKAKRLEALHWLAAQFPEAFDNRLKIRPLKTGVMHDVLACTDEANKHGITKTKLREAVVLYTRRIDYLTCLKAREIRVDLQGQPTEQVTEEEALLASQKIKKRVEKATKHAQQNIASKLAQYYQKQTPSYHPKRKPAERGNELYTHAAPTAPRSNTSITVKRKFTPQLNSQAVGRLKEKLSLVE